MAQSPPSGQAANPLDQPAAAAQPVPIASTGPNANPLDLFPQACILLLALNLSAVYVLLIMAFILSFRVFPTWVLMLLVQATWIFYAPINKYSFF